MKQIRESAIEKKVAEYARGRGCVTTKFKIVGVTGAPDRIFLLPGGIAVFIEFKKPGEVPTPAQRAELERLRALGFYATWADNSDEAIATIRMLLDNEKPDLLIKYWNRERWEP